MDSNPLPAVSPLTVVSLKPPQQSALFDEVDLGSELLSIEQDRATNKHTGSTLDRRQALRDEICMRLCSGLSQRRVAKLYGVGRNTVAALVDRLEKAGKMEPYKKRMAAKLGQGIEQGTDLLLERLEAGDVTTHDLPVVVGILSDKRALLLGDPTSIIESTSAPGLNQAAWDKVLEAITVESSVTIDSQSTAPLQIPQQ